MSEMLAQQTYEASQSSDAELARVHDFLATHIAAGRTPIQPRYFLAGADIGDQIEIPLEVHRVLLQVVDAMSQGLAVTITPQSKTLTTQQAADLLQVSRPTLVRLLDSGAMPYERVGSHRRVMLRDVIAYRDRRRAEQYDMLAELAANDADDVQDIEDVLNELKLARKTNASRRRGTIR